MICGACGRHTREDHLAVEQSAPHRKVWMCEACYQRSKEFYRPPAWKVYKVELVEVKQDGD